MEQKPELHLEIGHVLFIDIVGYSKLLIDEQREVQHELNDLARNTAQFQASDGGGRLTRLPTGDGMALVFRDSMEAPLRCAIEISKALKDRSDPQVRMGIHSGPVSEVTDVNERSNVAGGGMNIAQRVMDCGDAGHILLSKRVAEDLAQYRHWQPHLHDLGECEVKHGVKLGLVNFFTDEAGNPEPPQKCAAAGISVAVRPAGRTHASMRIVATVVTVLLIGAVILWALASRHRIAPHVAPAVAARPADVSDKSIAVLPFENRSEDKANTYFADGVQDEILTRLSKIADLKVISRTSTQHYKSAPENLSEIGRQLRVAHVVEGSVQKSGDAVRVNVQLIRAADDTHVWAETFDRKLTDVFAVETEVAKAIAERLQAKLTGHEDQVISARPTQNPEAYDAYLRGLAFNTRPALLPENFAGAQTYLKQAVQLDPQFAIAWALLASVDSLGYLTLQLPPTEELRAEARKAADTALSLQPGLGEAFVAQGYYQYGCAKDYDSATRYFEQARKLLPNNADTITALAYIERRRGNWDQSEKYFLEAEQLDPRNVRLLTQHGVFHLVTRRFNDAQRKCDQVLDILPDDPPTWRIKAVIAQAEGDLPRAAEIIAKAAQTNDVTAIRLAAYQAILERKPDTIVPRLRTFLANTDPHQLPDTGGQLPYCLGWAQQLAGDQAGAIDTWRALRPKIEETLEHQPTNNALLAHLALTCVGLGDSSAAEPLVDRLIADNPPEKDRLRAGTALDVAARVAAQTGKSDRAIELIEQLLRLRYENFFNQPLTPALLRLDPIWDPIRKDPRFQQLVASLAPAS